MSRGTRDWMPGEYLPLNLGVVLCVFLCCLVFVAGAAAAGDATTAPGEACPNESAAGFRAYLADCRAYEQASPPYKQGFEPKPEGISEDGSHVVLRSLGAFAGLEGGDTREGAKYELVRTGSGWETAAISAPASLFPAQGLDAESPDLSTTLFDGRNPSESLAADNFYLREEDGTILKIGPLLPPSVTAGPPANESESFKYQLVHYVDASADLSHVFFRMPRPGSNPGEEDNAWPGDTTVGGESLLEYSGTENSEPVLVGVKPGPGEAKNKPSEAPALISECSTDLGSFNSQDLYSAVSASGGTVFFTAAAEGSEGCSAPVAPEVNELYARVGGRESVAISEPSVGDCEACDTGVKAAAEFAGASEDGSKVFFLSAQELLAGASGPDLFEYDFDAPAGAKVLRVAVGSGAPEVQGVARVSEDGSHVYFVARGVLTSEPDRSLPAGHQQALAGGDNLYVFERDAAHPAGRVSFIAMLCSNKEESGTLTHVAQCPSAESDASDWQESDVRPVQATPDGRFLVFQSVADLVPGDTSGQSQVFEYDAQAGELIRVSRGAGNDEPQGSESANLNAAEILAPAYHLKTTPAAANTGLAVSGDGGVVVFASGGVLTRETEAGVASRFPTRSQYEYRSSVGEGGSIGAGDVYLVSPPAQGAPELDESGVDVFFLSGVSLVAGDTDTQFDLYDARVGGGFPAAAGPVLCEGAVCGGQPPVVPPVAAPASAGVPGGGNLTVSPPPPPPPPPPSGVKPGLTRAQLLARALKACKKDRSRARRVACVKSAHKRYGPVKAKKASNDRGGR